jgi:hypothetical protein
MALMFVASEEPEDKFKLPAGHRGRVDDRDLNLVLARYGNHRTPRDREPQLVVFPQAAAAPAALQSIRECSIPVVITIWTSTLVRSKQRPLGTALCKLGLSH